MCYDEIAIPSVSYRYPFGAGSTIIRLSYGYLSVMVRSLLLFGMEFIDALQGNVFYSIGPSVSLVCVIYLCK